MKSHFDTVEEVFLRSNYKFIDLAFYNALERKSKVFIIEDGFYDLNRSISFIKLLKNEYNNFLYKIYCLILFFINSVFTFDIKNSYKNNIKYKLKVEKLLVYSKIIIQHLLESNL